MDKINIELSREELDFLQKVLHHVNLYKTSSTDVIAQIGFTKVPEELATVKTKIEKKFKTIS